MGAATSALAGYIGMSIATKANCRTTHAAQVGGLKDALSVAVSGGAVMGMSVVGLGLLGLVIVYFFADGDPNTVNGYAMGASLMALFARSGGGIYTKGADMGADLVGKVEAGIPEDDPRNPAVIADNVGDNVGDVAGLGSDLFESYVESIIAALAIAAAITVGVTATGSTETNDTSVLMVIPFAIAVVGIFASIIGVAIVKFKGSTDPQGALMLGTYVSAALTALGSFIIIWMIGKPWVGSTGVEYSALAPFWASLVGVISGIVVGFMSEYYTSSKYKPVQRLSENSQVVLRLL